jgi:hypothetical protein
LIKDNLDKINWCELSTNPSAIELIEANLDKINWLKLSSNPAAVHLFEKNQDKINWFRFSQLPTIFEYDYEAMTRPFFEELMQNRFHPDNLDKFEGWGF